MAVTGYGTTKCFRWLRTIDRNPCRGAGREHHPSLPLTPSSHKRYHRLVSRIAALSSRAVEGTALRSPATGPYRETVPTPTPVSRGQMRVGQDFSTARSFFYARGGETTTDKTLVPIKWLPEGKVSFLDQTLLPHEEVWIETSDYRVIAEAIRRLQVRGAPLIGIAAGYGLALAAGAGEPVETAAKELRSTRPTAVNLSWAIDRCLRAVDGVEEPREMRERLIKEAVSIHKEDVAANHRIGDYGAKLLSADDQSILTHCNAGTLATGGYGTALGVIRSASANGRLCSVIATETRPLLQGARLTAWELSRDRIPCTVIVDSAAGSYMRRGEIDAVIVGADRIAANGDVANKIGTYPLAVLARENGIPFYVAAPSSTADLSLASGDDIPIEQRSPDEVTSLRSEHIVTLGLAVQAENPAFDVTPSRYVTAIITENGVAKPPFEESLERLCARSSGPQARESEVPARG